MKANLIIQRNEVVIRDYSLIEDEGLSSLVAQCEELGNPGIVRRYEDDDEELPDKHIIVIEGPTLESIFKFLDFAEIPVFILA